MIMANKTVALIEKREDGSYGIFTPDLQSTIFGEGKTVKEAKEDFENSVKEMVESFSENELPEELKNLVFEYKYDVSAVFNYIDCINVSKFAEKAKINASLMRQYSTGKAYISEIQARKIENSLHELGKELSEVSLSI